MIVSYVGQGCGGRGSVGCAISLHQTNDADADGEVVWS